MEAEDYCRFEASLVYPGSSRLPRATQQQNRNLGKQKRYVLGMVSQTSHPNRWQPDKFKFLPYFGTMVSVNFQFDRIWNPLGDGSLGMSARDYLD